MRSRRRSPRRKSSRRSPSKKCREHLQKKIRINLKNNKLPELCPLYTVILMHLIDINDNGRYADTTIMDIYSIMYCYDECSNELNENHDIYKCLCKKYFIEGNDNNDSNKYKEIRSSIKNHYDKTLQVKNLYENLINYIEEHIEKSNNFKFNIDHKVSLIQKDGNFNIWNTFEIIANSENNIIHFLIIPQFNKLNFYDKIINLMFNHYLIKNSSNDELKNLKRFKNKKIFSCILTLDSNEPIFYEFNITNEFNNYIKSYLFFEKYSKYNNNVLNFYNYCKINKPINTDSISYTLKKISEYPKLPDYIYNFFYDISKDIEKDKSNAKNILKKINLKELNDYLEKSCDKYINNNEEIDEDNDY